MHTRTDGDFCCAKICKLSVATFIVVAALVVGVESVKKRTTITTNMNKKERMKKNYVYILFG